MNRQDKIYRIWHTVLCVFYLLLSIFSWFMMMVSESTIGVTNRLYVVLIDIICGVFFAIPFLCFGSLWLSWHLKKKGSRHAFWVQFAPLAVFTLNLLLAIAADLILAQ